MSVISQADNDMTAATLDFFNSAWNQEQSGYFILDAVTNSNDSSNFEQYQLFPYTIVDDEMKPYPIQLEQLLYQSDGGLLNQHNNDISQLITPRQPIIQWNMDPENGLEVLRAPPLHVPLARAQDAQLHSAATPCFAPDEIEALPVGVRFLEPGTQPFEVVPITFLDNSKQRQTTFEYGQISPGLSPEEIHQTLGHKDSSSTDDKAPVESNIHGTTSDTATGLSRKLRRSKKRPLTKQQEQSKRREFLERNRKAAGKCRQNRKKLMDHLQEKRYEFKADNDLKKAAVQTMEDEIAQMKRILMVHSQSCRIKSIQAWAKNEADRSQKYAIGAGKKDYLSPEPLIDGTSPMSSSSSMGGSMSAHIDGPG